MFEPKPGSFFSVSTVAFFLSLLIPIAAQAQGKQAIVILRPEGTAATGCDGTVELSSQVLNDVKLNNKDEVRLLNLPASNPSVTVSRKSYEDSGKRKLRDLFALRWEKDGVLTAVSVAGQSALAALPDDMKPQKNVDQPLSSFYGVTVTGELRDGKQKRKVDLPLRSVWKIYFVTEGAPLNDSLFSHAADEGNVAIWEAYLRKTNNYRISEANTKMHEALIQCVRADLRSFLAGDYAALAKARARITKTQSISDNEVSRQLAADIRREQQQVEDARGKAEQLIKADKWDEAIDATEPIKKYLDTWPDLDQMYKHALKMSHEVHLNAGDKAFLATQLETSLNDCGIAWKRLPNSEQARTCVCRARNEIALRDSRKSRQIKRPKEAKELLDQRVSDSQCPQDARVTAELKESKCEYAQQLYAEARQLLGVGGAAPTSPRARRRAAAAASPTAAVNVKLIAMANKKDFRDARQKLLLAAGLCPEPPIAALLQAANRRLAEFCTAEARKALQRNDDGTAYVYLQSALAYTPDDAEVSGLLSDARDRFQQRTRVSVGAVFESSVRTEEAGVVISEVTDAIQSAATAAGLAQANVLGQQESAAAWRAVQASRPLNTPTVIFTGNILSAGVEISRNPRNVRSSYSYENPRWKEADRRHDAQNEVYKNCRKQAGANCASLEAQVAQLRVYRDQFQRTVREEYYFRENAIRMVGAARLSLRATDSISRGVRTGETLQAGDQWECVERSGVNPQDYNARDNNCPEPNTGAFFGAIVGNIKRDAHLLAVAQLRELPLSYYKRAQSAANRQQSIEDYLRFVFLTGDKSGSQAEQARAALIAFDPELTTDGVLR
jgi:hypothetical protein